MAVHAGACCGSPSTLRMIFSGTAVVLPLLAGYTISAYRVFGGTVRERTNY